MDLGGVVLGVSPDSETSHDKFRNKYGLPFHLLADTEHNVSTAYDAWGEKKNYGKTYMGIKRISYLIDENGIIKNVWPKVSPAKHAAEVLEALKED